MNPHLRAALIGIKSLFDLSGLTTRNRLTAHPQPWDDVAALNADTDALASDFDKVRGDIAEAATTGRRPEDVQRERHARERATRKGPAQ